MDVQTQRRIIENVTMLWTLNEVPEQPKENVLRGSADKTRQLTQERELQLGSSLAFIAASTDDMLKVMAVCVEEDSDRLGMTIRLASNTGHLSQTVASFKGIAITLEKASLRGMHLFFVCHGLIDQRPSTVESRNKVRQDLLHQILALDEPRILSRLRSRHAARSRKIAGRPALAELLSRTANDPSIRSGGSGTAKLKRVQSQSKRFLDTFSQFEMNYGGHDSQSSMTALADLVWQAFEYDTEYLQTSLHTVSALNPSLKNFLPGAIKKLGRYYGIANDLVDAARSSRHTIFRRITIEALEEPTIDTASVTANLQGFDAVLKRNVGSRLRKNEWQSHSSSLEAMRTKYESRIKNRATPWKIHAEIQLLSFYDQNQDILRPRIICSSKSACFLCNLFIQTHGKFYTPRTHGRLYDKWILPGRGSNQISINQDLLSAAAEFNRILQAKILQTLQHKRRAYLHPNESVLPSWDSWSSTSTLTHAEAPQYDSQSAAGIRQKMAEEPGDPESKASALIDTACPARSALESKETVDQILEGTSNAQRASQDEITIVDLSTSMIQSLSRGQSVHYEIDSLAEPTILCTETLNLHISSERVTPHDKSSWGPSLLQIKWLTTEDHAAIKTLGTRLIDADTLPSDQDTIINIEPHPCERSLGIRNGEHVLLLQWSHEHPQDCL